MLAAPIYLPDAGPDARAIATLNVCFFNDRPEAAEQAKQALGQLADTIGRLWAGYQTQRLKLAAACLRQRLQVPPPSSRTSFETIRAVHLEVLRGDGFSGFARLRDDHRLYCVTTTGLEPWTVVSEGLPAPDLVVTGPGVWPPDHLGTGGHPAGVVWREDGTPISYDLKEDHGYTTYLAAHCGRSVRKNDVLSMVEKGVPDDFPRRPLEKYREQLAPARRSTGATWVSASTCSAAGSAMSWERSAWCARRGARRSRLATSG